MLLDISKAFDSVDHEILIVDLLKINIPKIIVRFIRYWYSNQYVRVRNRLECQDEYVMEWGREEFYPVFYLVFTFDGLLETVANAKL